MRIPSRTGMSRRAAEYLAGALTLGVAVVACATVAYATETLTLKTAISMPNGGKITSFDISAVDITTGLYTLGDRTNKAIEVINTSTNTVVLQAGLGLFKGATGNNNTSGPDGAMIVRSREIWAGDGDSTLKILSLGNGGLLATISTGGQFRVDEMCFDPVSQYRVCGEQRGRPAFHHRRQFQEPFDYR